MRKWLTIALVVIICFIAAIMVYIFKPTVTTNEKYSSVIIDCSNMGLARGMAPKILDSAGKEIYPGAAARSMNMKDVVESGVVTYSPSVDDALKHQLAGLNPLLLRAKSIDGIIKSDPVIEDEDALKLTAADNSGKFLSERKVIFVQ